MTVQELINELEKIKDKTVSVFAEKKTSDGCDTCGWGASYDLCDLTEVNDLEMRVVLGFH
jgi:hypothetical protein